MSLDYLEPTGTVIARLEAAHDPNRSIIRAGFFAAENAFFRAHIRNQEVLVGGSGLGHDSFELADYNASVLGVELNPNLVEKAKAELRRRQLWNVSFLQRDMCNLTRFDDHLFGSAVVNMGTLGTLEDPALALNELLRVASAVYADFYLPSGKGIGTRIQMYTEEGWQNVRWDPARKRIVSDDGLSSASFSEDAAACLAGDLKAKLETTTLCDFAFMAKFWR